MAVREIISRRLCLAIITLSIYLFSSFAWSSAISHALDRSSLLIKNSGNVVLLDAAQIGDDIIAVGERGIIVLSNDGGESWRQVPTPVSVTLTAVSFADENNGYVVGHGGTVLKTSDGGETWTRKLDGNQVAKLALAAAKSQGNELAIRDAEWLVSDGPDKPFLDVLTKDKNNAVVIGAYGLAFQTSDGGNTWTSWIDRLANSTGMHLYSIRSKDNRILIAGERGLVRLSNDSGNHFIVLDTSYTGSFFTSELTQDNRIVVAGLRGNTLESRDSGASWTILKIPMDASITASTVSQDGSLLLTNQAGFLFKVLNGNTSVINKKPLPSLNGVLLKKDGALLTLSAFGTSLLNSGDTK